MLSYIDGQKFHNNLQLLFAFQKQLKDAMPVQYDMEQLCIISSILLAFLNTS